MSAENESPAYAALRAAGYEEKGLRWWRRMEGEIFLHLVWGEAGLQFEAWEESPERTVKVGVAEHDPPTDLAARLPELEARALAAMRALRGEGEG